METKIIITKTVFSAIYGMSLTMQDHDHFMIRDPYFYIFFIGGLLFSIFSDYDDPKRKSTLTVRSIITSIIITAIVSFLSMFAYQEGYISKFMLYMIVAIMSVFGHAIIIKYRTPFIDSSGSELVKLPKTASQIVKNKLGRHDNGTTDPVIDPQSEEELPK